MFSYLRAHHRRAGSTPTSPASPSFRSPQSTSSLAAADFRSPDLPPVLPPIPRVTSTRLEPADGGDGGGDGLNAVGGGEREGRRGGGDGMESGINEQLRDGRASFSPGMRGGEERNPHANAGAGFAQVRRPHTAGAPTGLRSRGQTASPHSPSPANLSAALSDSDSTRPLPSPLFFAQAAPSRLDTAGAGPAAAPAAIVGSLSAVAEPSINASSASTSGTATSTTKQAAPLQSSSMFASQTNLQPSKPGKKGLHLRNPMSLLLRRRSGQPLEISEEALVTHKSPPLPDKEPWIRGTGVHDFSAPRPVRNYSYGSTPTIPTLAGFEAGRNQEAGQDNGGAEMAQTPSEEHDRRFDREHTPVFKEHFEDDVDPATRHSRVIAESLANQDFLSRNSLQPPAHEAVGPSYARAQRLSPQATYSPAIEQPTSINTTSPIPPLLTKTPPTISPPSIQPDDSQNANAAFLSPVLEDSILEEEPTPEPTPRRRMASQTSSRTRSRALSGSEASINGLPAHMNSRASRFSFQYGGSDSALQELMLEERHKEKEAKRKAALATGGGEQDVEEEEEEDEFDYEGMDEMDGEDGFGFEEEPIPGMEDEDDYLSGSRMRNQMGGLLNGGGVGGSGGFYMQGSNGGMGLDQRVGRMELPETVLEDSELEDISKPHTKPAIKSDSVTEHNIDFLPGADNALGLVTTGSTHYQDDPTPPAIANQLSTRSAQELGETHEDDLYFDDGLIDEANYEVSHFNEEVFDDPSHPFYERQKLLDNEVSPMQQSDIELASPNLATIVDNHAFPAPPTTFKSIDAAPSNGSVMYSGSMDAYHKALAQAANKAAADGRFEHTEPLLQDNDNGEDLERLDPSHPTNLPAATSASYLSTDASFLTHNFAMSSLPPDYEDPSFDDFDCALEDDPIIAAANAEALANDSDGFYGHEFGFYASARNDDAEFANGGYFGDRGVDLNRKKSVREPNLTPITERSEYSHRNSFVSLHRPGDLSAFGGALPSPGLAQLARMSPFGWDDEEMSFTQLMRLRKDTFGGGGGGNGSGSDGGRSGKSSPMWNSSPTNTQPSGSALGLPKTSSGLVAASKQMYSVSVGNSPRVFPVGWNSGNESSENLAAMVGGEVEQRTEGTEMARSGSGDDYLPFHTTSRPLQRQSLPSPLHAPVSFQSFPYPQPAQPYQPNHLQQQQHPLSPTSTTSTTSPTTTTTTTTDSPTWRKTHSRGNGSADSVTYVKERQNSGDFRWVLERRRTAESGELELIGREVVQGGRI